MTSQFAHLVVLLSLLFSLAAGALAEPCRFTSAGTKDPFSRFFRIGEVTCGEGSGPRRGIQNVFWRSSEAMTAEVVAIDRSESEVKHFGLAFLTLDTPLRKGERLAAWIPAYASLLPIAVDERVAVVPADIEIVPIVLQGHEPVAVGDPLTLKVAERRTASLTRDALLITWLEYRGASSLGKSFIAPLVTLSAAGKTVEPLVRIDAHRQGDMPLVIFRAKAGDYALTLGGRGWRKQQRAVALRDGVSVEETPLIASPVHTLSVQLDVVTDPRRFGAVDPSKCRSAESAARKADAPQLEPGEKPRLVIESCEGLHAGMTPNMVDRGRCEVEGSRLIDLDLEQPRVEFPDLAAGAYVLSFYAPNVEPIRSVVEIHEGRDGSAVMTIKYSRIFGRVTQGEKPVAARLDFPSGSAVSDPDTGDYEVVSHEPPRKNEMIPVTVCGENDSYHFFPSETLAENARLDIEIPTSILKVSVHDKETGEAVKDASVDFAILMEENRNAAYIAGMWGKTDVGGTLTIRHLPLDKYAMVCASREDYVRECSEARQFKGDEQATIDLRVSRTDVHRGQVAWPFPLGATIAWWSPRGEVTEIVRTKDDNSFTYKKEHAGESAAVISAALPLWIIENLQAREDVLQLEPPRAPARRAQVSFATDTRGSDAFVTVSLGDLVIPTDVVGWHQHAHGRQSSIGPGRPIEIGPIFETRPIAVLVLPINDATRRVQKPAGIDYFFLAELQPFILRRPATEIYIEFPQSP